ncbi:hypothetical protein EV668_2953 [Enterovirga rhinocerotis]|uniref:Uncharacterized protein n=1 Tax=Enterovirga rhinocerotis TaxID=1339210 RepID=A0A4R7BX03_9HYPH|nr:hypothetical protein EV668_2953 [Enterovirga rhinocerotis]
MRGAKRAVGAGPGKGAGNGAGKGATSDRAALALGSASPGSDPDGCSTATGVNPLANDGRIGIPAGGTIAGAGGADISDEPLSAGVASSSGASDGDATSPVSRARDGGRIVPEMETRPAAGSAAAHAWACPGSGPDPRPRSMRATCGERRSPGAGMRDASAGAAVGDAPSPASPKPAGRRSAARDAPPAGVPPRSVMASAGGRDDGGLPGSPGTGKAKAGCAGTARGAAGRLMPAGIAVGETVRARTDEADDMMVRRTPQASDHRRPTGNALTMLNIFGAPEDRPAGSPAEISGRPASLAEAPPPRGGPFPP